MDEDTHKVRVNVGRRVTSAPPLPRNMVDGMRPAVARSPLTTKVHVRTEDPEPDIPAEPEDEMPAAVPELELDDHNSDTPSKGVAQPNKFKRIVRGYWRRKLWTLPLTAVIILAVIAAVPASRYKVLAFFVTKPFTVTVTDSTTGTPVSGATIKLAGKAATTDSKGKVSVTAPVGNQSLIVSKTYYKGVSQSVFVDITGSNAINVKLVATGRQVPVKVVDKITGKPVPEVVLTFGNTNAKTDLNGQATVVLPTSSPTQSVVLTVDGYNDLSAKVQVTTQLVAANTFAMMPKGRVYFLSNLTGKVDVVSTNLDGSDRKTVLAGTGSEDKDNTVLLASRDWKYLALLSKRDGGDNPKLFLINTSTGRVSTIDSTAADYTLVGWSNHYFVYQLNHSDLQVWQPGRVVLKSYSADTAQTVNLFSNAAQGTNSSDALYQDITGRAFLGSEFFYVADWYPYGNSNLMGKGDSLIHASLNGPGSKVSYNTDAVMFPIENLTVANPKEAYFQVSNVGSSNYYRLDQNGNATQSNTIVSTDVTQQYPIYLVSPSGKLTLWSSTRDGKRVLFVGDASGGNGVEIKTSGDYSPYGWYTDNYLLLQKNNSELYIVSASGGTPLKISDYFKPDYLILGYGGY